VDVSVHVWPIRDGARDGVHDTVRAILGRRLGVPPERIEWRRGRNGKPELIGAAAGLRANLSHSGGLAALAVAVGPDVGVDIQRLAPGLNAEGLAARYFRPDEARFVAEAAPAERLDRFVVLWARKEACLKAAGGRLAEGLRLPVLGEAGPGDLVVRDPGGRLPGPYLVRDVPVPAGYRAAVALTL
jgi:4'-phosphopantetheinyl transferase